jgi:hypothetical protein
VRGYRIDYAHDLSESHCRLPGETAEARLLYGVHRTLSVIPTQAVEDGFLTANPALCMGKFRAPPARTDADEAAIVARPAIAANRASLRLSM